MGVSLDGRPLGEPASVGEVVGPGPVAPVGRPSVVTVSSFLTGRSLIITGVGAGDGSRSVFNTLSVRSVYPNS